MATQHANLTEADLHETKGVSTAATGTILKANAGVGAWSFQEYSLVLDIADIDTAASFFVVAPYAGTITKIWSVIDTAITVANNTLTCSILSAGVTTAITNGTITIGFSGAVAGDVDSCVPTALNIVAAGDAIKIATDGGSTTATRCHITIIIARTA